MKNKPSFAEITKLNLDNYPTGTIVGPWCRPGIYFKKRQDGFFEGPAIAEIISADQVVKQFGVALYRAS